MYVIMHVIKCNLFNDSITICSRLATSHPLLIKSFTYSSLKPTAREGRNYWKGLWESLYLHSLTCKLHVITTNVIIWNEVNGAYSISTTITSFLIRQRKVIIIITRIVITITCRKRRLLWTIWSSDIKSRVRWGLDKLVPILFSSKYAVNPSTNAK